MGKRRTDNLKMEGSMQGLVSEAKNASQAIQKVNFGKAAAKARNATSSIVVGDDISSTTKAIEQHEAKRKSSASSSTTVKAASATVASATSLQQKQTKGSGVASTVVQSTDQEATIKAVNTDKFASSLRESAGVQIGVQKDLSVIDAHRRQSSANAAMMAGSSNIGGGYQQQSYLTNNIYGGAGEVQRWSSSAHSDTRQQQHFSAQQQQQASVKQSAWSTASQQQQRQYQQQFQQQRQQKMAWQEQQQQSTNFNASRRKTWAESSVFHGGLAFAGEYHDHRCPASGLNSGAATPPFKYERQTSSGHKMFLPSISN